MRITSKVYSDMRTTSDVYSDMHKTAWKMAITAKAKAQHLSNVLFALTLLCF